MSFIGCSVRDTELPLVGGRDEARSGIGEVGVMTTDDRAAGGAGKATTETSLDEWRSAERALAVARRGRIAANASADAAEQATNAAIATAAAAKTALEAMVLAEASAQKTAMAARLAARETAADLADADADEALAEVGEAAAKGEYRNTVARVEQRHTPADRRG
jgi:hypothetical protein